MAKVTPDTSQLQVQSQPVTSLASPVTSLPVIEWYGVRCPGESIPSFAVRRREALRVAAIAVWFETLPGVKPRTPSRSTAAEMYDRAQAIHTGKRTP